MALTILFAVPAGAAPSVGHVAVSNPTPAPRARSTSRRTVGARVRAVSISLSGTVLARTTADAVGAVHAEVLVPARAPQFATLAVAGAASSGVPQQIVTNLTVAGTEHEPAPRRPWTAICLVLAIATGCY